MQGKLKGEVFLKNVLTNIFSPLSRSRTATKIKMSKILGGGGGGGGGLHFQPCISTTERQTFMGPNALCM